MSDIIKGAKQLLDGATPAPWEWVGYSLEAERSMVLDFQCVTEFGMNGATREVEVTPEDEALIAAAPELAQALAEETYEYQIQTRSQRMPTWLAITDDTLQKWYPEDKYNEIIREGRVFRGGAGFEMRVLRRRVSPPEVINE